MKLSIVVFDVPYIKLVNRYDRLGANLTSFICQIIYAHYNNYYIDYDELNYKDTIFVQAIVLYISNYNKNKNKTIQIEIIDEANFWCTVHVETVNNIKSDLFSYFSKYLYADINHHMNEIALLRNFDLPFDPNNTILVHLRLDDLNFNNRFDYDGNISSYYYADKVNRNDPAFNSEKENEYYHSIGLVNYMSNNNETMFAQLNVQAPMKDDKIQNIINICKLKYPTDEVIIVCSTIGDATLPYRTIRSIDPSMDLYYLCNCKKIILSRSTFSMTSLYLSKGTDIWIPIWGHTAATGLTTKYDKNPHFNYFI